MEEAPDDTQSLLLYRSQTTAEADDEAIEDSRLLLCDNLQEVGFSYLDKDGEEREAWEDEEGDDGTMVLPSLITIHLRFNDSSNDEPGTLFTSALTLPMAGM